MEQKRQRSIVPLMVRLPFEVHDDIVKEAQKRGHSLNAEIIRRLKLPLQEQDEKKKLQLVAHQAATTAVNQVLKRVNFAPPSKRVRSGQ